ncbi:MAG: SHD1 domain-containing protein [Rubripirellula sp.]
MLQSPTTYRTALLLLVSLIGSAAIAETWSDTTGKLQVEAEFLGVEGKSILLRRDDGKTAKVPIERLSVESREQAKRLYKAMLAKPSPTSPIKSRPERQEPTDVLSKNVRWHLHCIALNRDGYAMLLDHFKLEIASIGTEPPELIYVRGLSTRRPLVRRGSLAQDKRQPFLLKKGPSLQFHHEFHQELKLPIENRRFVILIDEDLDSYLSSLELIYLKTKGYRSLNAVKKTEFSFEYNDYEFGLAVTKQLYRVP